MSGQSVGSGQIDMLGHLVLGQVSWLVQSVWSGQIDMLGHSVLGQVSSVGQSVRSGQIYMLGHSVLGVFMRACLRVWVHVFVCACMYLCDIACLIAPPIYYSAFLVKHDLG